MTKKAEKKALTLKLERKTGVIHTFTLLVGSKLVDFAPADKGITWKGEIAGDGKTRFTIHALGVKDASFQVTFDLPGTADDFAPVITMLGNSEHLVFAL